MIETSKERKGVNIKATVQKHKVLIPTLPATHSLSGCNAFAQCYGVRKAKVSKVRQTGVQVALSGNIAANIPDTIQEGTMFSLMWTWGLFLSNIVR